MGTRNSNLIRKNRIGLEWEICGERAHEKCTIVKHRYNGRIADCYHISLDPRTDFSSELEIYNYRRLQNSGLVQVYGAELINTEAPSFCGMEKVVKVLTEPIPYRLETLFNLRLEEALYILMESLRGFYEIFQRLGAVQINDELICITPEGFVKVWVNRQLAHNHPRGSRTVLQVVSNDYDIDTVGRSEAQSVRNIFEVVEQHCTRGRYPPELLASIISSKNMGFATAQILILDYCSNYGVTLADHLDIEAIKKTSTQTNTSGTEEKQYGQSTHPLSSKPTAAEKPEQSLSGRNSDLQRLDRRFIFEGSK